MHDILKKKINLNASKVVAKRIHWHHLHKYWTIWFILCATRMIITNMFVVVWENNSIFFIRHRKKEISYTTDCRWQTNSNMRMMRYIFRLMMERSNPRWEQNDGKIRFLFFLFVSIFLQWIVFGIRFLFFTLIRDSQGEWNNLL